MCKNVVSSDVDAEEVAIFVCDRILSDADYNSTWMGVAVVVVVVVYLFHHGLTQSS